jgi:hypothetical protein
VCGRGHDGPQLMRKSLGSTPHRDAGTVLGSVPGSGRRCTLLSGHLRRMPQPAPALDLLIPSLLWVTACSTGRQRPSTVAAPAAPPVATLTAVDYGFEAPDTIEAGLTAFHLVNEGSQLHMAQLIKLEGDRSLDDFLVAYTEAFRTTGPRPPWAPRYGGPGAAHPGGSSNATQYLEPGNYAWISLMNVPDGIPHVEVDLTAGDYVVLCFVTAPDGRSHVEHGMIQHVRID